MQEVQKEVQREVWKHTPEEAVEYISDMQAVHVDILEAPANGICASTNKEEVADTAVLPDALVPNVLVLHGSVLDARDVRSIAAQTQTLNQSFAVAAVASERSHIPA